MDRNDSVLLLRGARTSRPHSARQRAQSLVGSQLIKCCLGFALNADEPSALPALRPLIIKLRLRRLPIIRQSALGADRVRALKIIKQCIKPGQLIFVGVVDPINPRIETPEEIRDQILEAAKYIPVEQLGTTDDCGFSPFSDDTSTSRDTAFAKIRARVLGTELATREIEGALSGTDRR